MKYGKYIIFILIINFILLLFYGKPIIESDGLTYYIIARSLAEDLDFNASPKNYHHNRRMFHYIHNEKTNTIGVTFSGGYALLIAPFIRGTRFVSSFLPYINTLQPYHDWPPFIDALAILLANFFYLNILFIILFIYLAKLFNPKAAFFSIYTAFFGMPLIYYTFTAPSFSQFVDAFAFGMFFIFSFLFLKDTGSKKSLVFLFLSGIFLGISVFIRNINLVFGIPYAIGILIKEINNRSRIYEIIMKYSILAISGLPFAIMLLSYNKTQYGDPFTTGYSLHGNFILRSTLHYQLFHPVRGLFIYTPLAIIVILGLIFIKKQKFYRFLSIAYIIAFFSLCQFFHYWRGGVSYGHRFSVHLYPIYVYALCLIFSSNFIKYKKIIIYSLIIIFTFFAFAHYNLYIASVATRDARNYLFRERDKYDIPDIAKSAYIALENMQEWFNAGKIRGLFYLQVYHYSPSLIFLPVSNIHKNHMTFLRDVSFSEKEDHIRFDLIFRSFREQIWHPRIFLYQEEKRNLFHDERLFLASTPSMGVHFIRGRNKLSYKLYPDITYSVYLNGNLILEREDLEYSDKWLKRAMGEERIALLFYYAFAEERDGEPRVTKYYWDRRYFEKSKFSNFLSKAIDYQDYTPQ